MTIADLDTHQVFNSVVQEHISAKRCEEARRLALRGCSAALCDLGLAELACGNYESGVAKLQDALNADAGNRSAFHNLAAALLARRQLKGKNLEALTAFITERWNKVSWVRQYRQLLYMPRFLNVEFVRGKCNLKCRMCRGRNSEGYADRLSAMAPENFERLLVAAPTIGGFTLSGCDSDPLLHPQFDRIMEIARDHQTALDVFTNGHALGPRICRKMVDLQIVQMINFSIDAATPQTYRNIRGADLTRLIGKIEMLQGMKKERGVDCPWLSFSFVTMADNVHELPDFVRMARRLGALRVFVEDLNGWEDGGSGNRPAPACPTTFEYLQQAQEIAAEGRVKLLLPGRLQKCLADKGGADVDQAGAAGDSDGAGSASSAVAQNVACCSWIAGVEVMFDGRLRPCCMLDHPPDLGNIGDGPLIKNKKYARVKDLLLTGKVFEGCADKKMCQYVQQQHAAGIPLRFVTREELGELAPDPMFPEEEQAQAAAQEPSPDSLSVASVS